MGELCFILSPRGPIVELFHSLKAYCLEEPAIKTQLISLGTEYLVYNQIRRKITIHWYLAIATVLNNILK